MNMLLTALVVCAAVAAARGDMTCRGDNNDKIFGFNTKAEYMTFPCKYWALRNQKCGNYTINLSPGNIWLRDSYHFYTMWMGVKEIGSDKSWEGRTSNKIVVKFFNANGVDRDLFRKKGGNMETAVLFKPPYVEEGRTHIVAENGDFMLSVTPFHPKMKDFRQSRYEFTCFKDGEMQPYPTQMCGNATKEVIQQKATSPPFSLVKAKMDVRKQVVIYHDLFMNEDVVQTNEKCKAAVDIFKNKCTTQEQRLETLKQCQEIIGSKSHTECVTLYSCDPMDVFNACLEWGCTGKGFERKENELCKAVGKGIDQCPRFESELGGSLTGTVESFDCYKEFRPLKKK